MANSKIYLGSTNIGSLFQGADDISIYLGENKVYPLDDSFKWKATYQDSHVESAECDSSSAITGGEINKTNLISVEIGDCVTSIDVGAFDGCSSLTSVVIPDSVTSIGDSAFHSCTSLTSIDIPNSVTNIEVYAFRFCSGLTSIDIPSGVTSIGEAAFDGCTSLTSVTVNAITPPTLDGGIFYGSTCPIYVPCESLNVYKSAPYWSDYASRIQAIPNSCPKFYAKYSGGETYRLECDGNTTLATGNTRPTGYEYSAMTEAIIGDCVTEIGYKAFSGCTSLTSINIPTGVTSIGDGAFEGCSGLTTIDIPNGITTIGQHTFYNCSSLTSIVIPDGVTSIGNAAFQNCRSLEGVTIPSGVTSIEYQAFVQCTSFISIICLATTPPTLSQRVFNTGNSCPIYVPSASLTAYQTAWSDYASRIQAIP